MLESMSLRLRALAGAAVSASMLSVVLPTLAAQTQGTPALAPSASKPAAPVSAEPAVHLAALSVDQIIAKHVAARGSAQAWRSVRSLQMAGTIEAGRGSLDPVATKTARTGKHFPVREGTVSSNLPDNADRPQKQLPFVLDSERPNRSRLEVEFAGKTAIQVFDGTQGWKYRPFLNRTDVEAFSPEEARSESARAEPEGLIVDHEAKGSRVTLDGTERVAGMDTYRLKVTRKDGSVAHVWIDGKSFLDVRVDGTPRHMDGKMHDVHVVQRDFRQVNGVTIPFVLETSVDGYDSSHKMMIEKVTVNPAFDASTFAKPKV